MRWEEEYEEIPAMGCIEITEMSFIGAEDSDVIVKLEMPLSKWNALSRTEAWKQVCEIIESDKAQRKRRIGF